MKIIMFSDSYGTLTTTFIKNEVSYFSRKHDLIYVAQKIEGASDLLPNTYSLPFNQSAIKRKLDWFLWQKDIRCSFNNKAYSIKLNSLLSKEKPDIIHCHFGYEALKLLDNIKENTCPILVHFHGYDASQMLRKKSYVRALKKNFSKNNITPIVVSDKMKVNLMNAGIDMSKAKTLRYGIDLQKFTPGIYIKKPDDLITFLQISSLVEKKGHEYTMDAFALFFKNNVDCKKRVKIIFTGDGDRRSYLQQYAIAKDLHDNVEFIGNVNYEKAVELLNNANIFVHHSITAGNGDEEGIPNAIIEAMAMELPVLSTFHAGIPELVKDGINGLLCKEKDVNKFALQIAEIINWNKLPENRAVVDQSYNMTKHNRQLEKIYEDLIYNNTVKRN